MRITFLGIGFCLILGLTGCELGGGGSWIHDSWIPNDTPVPGTNVVAFLSNGTIATYEDYNETILSLTSGVPYDFDGTTLTIAYGILGSGPVTKLDDNHFQWDTTATGGGITDLYRKSAYPLGSVSSTPITVNGGWVSTSLADAEIKYYSFSTTNGTSYTIQWDDAGDGSGAYDADVEVTAYHENYVSTYFAVEDNGYSFPQNFTATATETVYIEVAAFMDGGGTVRIQVTSL